MNKEEYLALFATLDELWDLKTAVDKEFLNVCSAIEAYEDIHYSIPKPKFWSRVEYFFDTHRWWSLPVWFRYWWR